MSEIKKEIPRIITARKRPIHKWLNTHHHDQSITWNNFKTINAIVKR